MRLRIPGRTQICTRVTLALLLAGGRLAAQQPLVAVNGTVYDSLRAAPLAGALVAIVGTARTAITDSAGRFRFDSLAPNSYTFTAQHDALDSTGFSGLSAKARVDGVRQVQIALPSFGTLWHAAGGHRPATPDSGFIFGTVRATEDGHGAADVKVTAAWIDVTA